MGIGATVKMTGVTRQVIPFQGSGVAVSTDPSQSTRTLEKGGTVTVTTLPEAGCAPSGLGRFEGGCREMVLGTTTAARHEHDAPNSAILRS